MNRQEKERELHELLNETWGQTSPISSAKQNILTELIYGASRDELYEWLKAEVCDTGYSQKYADNMEHQVNTLVNRIDDLREERDNWEEKHDDMENEYDEKVNEVDELEDRINELECEVRELEERVEELEEEVSELEDNDDFDDVKSDIKDLYNKISDTPTAVPAESVGKLITQTVESMINPFTGINRDTQLLALPEPKKKAYQLDFRVGSVRESFRNIVDHKKELCPLSYDDILTLTFNDGTTRTFRGSVITIVEEYPNDEPYTGFADDWAEEKKDLKKIHFSVDGKELKFLNVVSFDLDDSWDWGCEDVLTLKHENGEENMFSGATIKIIEIRDNDYDGWKSDLVFNDIPWDI